jgi:hypothetical protein
MKYLELAVIAAAAVYRVVITVRRVDLARVAFTAATVLVAAAFAVSQFTGPVSRAVHSPNSAELIAHLLVVGGALGTQIFLLALRYEAAPQVKLICRAAISTAVAVAMTSLFCLAPVHVIQVADFDNAYTGVLYAALYRMLFDAYIAWCLVDNARLCWRHAREPGDEGRSVSLATIGAACALGAIEAVLGPVTICLLYLGLNDPSSWLTRAGSAISALAAVALGVGILAPRPATWLLRLRRAQGSIHTLKPLWTDLSAAFPGVVLRPQISGSPLRNAELRLARHHIEIVDALSGLRISVAASRRIAGDDRPAWMLGQLLRRTRSNWLVGEDGVVAAELLPARQDLAALEAVAAGYAARARQTRAHSTMAGSSA